MTDTPRMIFVNLPVTDLARSMEFYAALGFTNEPRFTDDTAACMVRSEEHTSELQSLMRISYALFCLKNKTLLITTINTYQVNAPARLETTFHYDERLTHIAN